MYVCVCIYIYIHIALQDRRLWVQFPMVSLKLFIDTIDTMMQYGTGVDSASNRKEYQEYFLAGKG